MSPRRIVLSRQADADLQAIFEYLDTANAASSSTDIADTVDR